MGSVLKGWGIGEWAECRYLVFEHFIEVRVVSTEACKMPGASDWKFECFLSAVTGRFTISPDWSTTNARIFGSLGSKPQFALVFTVRKVVSWVEAFVSSHIRHVVWWELFTKRSESWLGPIERIEGFNSAKGSILNIQASYRSATDWAGTWLTKGWSNLSSTQQDISSECSIPYHKWWRVLYRLRYHCEYEGWIL